MSRCSESLTTIAAEANLVGVLMTASGTTVGHTKLGNPAYGT